MPEAALSSNGGQWSLFTETVLTLGVERRGFLFVRGGDKLAVPGPTQLSLLFDVAFQKSFIISPGYFV